MFEYKCELYLNGSWQSYNIYNQLRFDERKDGQVTTGLCYIRTEQKTRFEPMRKARITMTDKSDNSSKVKYYFAYFKGQQRQRAGYWLHEVLLIDPAKRTQGELINGLRVIQNADNSITLYDTFVRLCNTTPLRLTSQSNLYNPTTDTTIVTLMQSIRSPEYAWSCRTLFWECLKEIGMDMGGYFPTVEFGDDGRYIISFFPTERKGQTITDFACISLANGYDENQVCSEIDTDISNVIATNQGTASTVFPSQVGWITPRTNYRVTHTFSKNWSMLSSWLKQNKQYRNTRIPTDILTRNLHYQDYFVISETDGVGMNLGEKGLLTLEGVSRVADVFTGGRPNENSEINNFGLYHVVDNTLKTNGGVIVSCNSFGVKKSIVFSAKMENNLTAGKKVDPANDYYCQEVLYTDEDGEFLQGLAGFTFGIMDTSIDPNEFPLSYKRRYNYCANPVLEADFYVDKSSAEQIAMTYQVHFVSNMPDIVIGGLMANNSPLVQDRTEELKYQLWGLTSPLDNLAVIVNSSNGTKIADITGANRVSYFGALAFINADNTLINIVLYLYLQNKMPGNYIGWAITDENGRLYLARNSHPNVNQELYFNHLHKYHEQD